MCVTNTTGRRPVALSFGSKLANQSLVSPRIHETQSEASNGAVPVPSSNNGMGVINQQVLDFSQFLPEQQVSTQASPQSFDYNNGGEDMSTPPKKKRRRRQRPGLTAKRQERHFVHHNYHDHALDSPSNNTTSLSADSCVRRRGGVPGSFPRKLHQMLDQIEADGLSSVISWQPHGRCFVIHKPKEFTDHVMPKYFRQTKLTSFQRQLNLYGFQRLTKGLDDRGYYHELFLKGRPFLCDQMVRTKVKGTRFKAASSPEEEPDFYSMPRVLPLDMTECLSDHDCSSVGSDLTPLLEPIDPFVDRVASDEPIFLSACEAASTLDAFVDFTQPKNPNSSSRSPVTYPSFAPYADMAPPMASQDGLLFGDSDRCESLQIGGSLVNNPDESIVDFVNTWVPYSTTQTSGKDASFDDDARFGLLLESFLSK